jgi:hypothetical protein
MVVGPVTLRYKKRKGAEGTHAKVHRDLPLTPTLLLIRLLRRGSSGKTPHHAATTPESPAYTDPCLLPLRRADLLPVHRQVPLRRLQ